MIAALAAVAAVLLAWVRLRRTFTVVVVQGISMAPTLRRGDRLLVRRAREGALRTGQIAVLRDPTGNGHLIKRIAAVHGEPAPASVPHEGPVPSGALAVLGDNPEVSYDSRHCGLVRESDVLGVVIRPLRHGQNRPEGA
ncbi:S26 family signal peptidase [Nonomuraea sp. NPDC050310]|uniref:S26 family signal peptidase n=1 Tax=unclassified Nonomuraea TaxID=2593643 RepID=UPI0033F4CD37